MLHYYIYTTLTLFLLISLSSPKNLTFNAEGTFTILQLTDLHYGEGRYSDENTLRLQAELITRVQPDVVIVTGDVVSGYAYHGQPNFYEDAWAKFGKPFIDTQTYYAFAMGNHDAQDDTLPEEIFELEKMNNYSLCLHSQHLSHETFNYYLPVYSSLKEDNISSLLWIFDSHSVGCVEDTNSWGCVSDEQVQWYKQHSEDIKNKHGSDIHHLGFFHIPFPEYMDLYNDYEFYGHRNEDVSCPLLNTGFFDAIKEEGDIQAVFVGHDHLNDYGGWIDDVELVYGRRMGYAGYGEIVGFQRGARVIELTEKLNEDGTIEVDRNHYVIVEYPEKEKEEERVNQKQMKRRKGPRQMICVLGKATESFWLALVWLAFAAIVIGAMGAGANVLIGMLVRKRLRDSPDAQAKRMVSEKDEEFSRLDGEWSI